MLETLKSSIAVQRHFWWLTSNRSIDNIYESFLITVAFVLRTYNLDANCILSLGTALLDNWFYLNNVDESEYKNNLEIGRIKDIINNKEMVYKEYFKLYDDKTSSYLVRVYYPKNGESWVSWNEQYSVEVRLNLIKGAEYGFTNIGFGYCKIDDNGSKTSLKLAYVQDEREVLYFEDVKEDVDNSKILWIA